ncbi:MAG: hypothetical protein HXY34_06495 [Candidatus Thorarchaeota archaeon]|nr:hypothetical protein [Candidatus Thorarchaeota archaeon]
MMRPAAIVDIDDTCIDATSRLQAIWSRVLEADVQIDDVETLDSAQLFEKYATDWHRRHTSELRLRFWNLLLCIDEEGYQLAEVDRPVAGAAEVLSRWCSCQKVLYLTGRPENTRELTVRQLRSFGFPVDDIELVMYRIDDYERTRGASEGPTLPEVRRGHIRRLVSVYEVTRVIDDYPNYFPLYREAGIPQRIGLNRLRMFSREQFLEKGATMVIGDWREIDTW